MAIVWQLTAIQFDQTSHIRGVILHGNASGQHKKRNSIRTFINVARSFLRKPCGKCRLVLAIDGSTFYPVTTDAKGGFSLDIEQTDFKQIKLLSEDHSKEYRILQEYPVIFKPGSSPLEIISDIDDTILVSHTLSTQKRLGTLFFIPAHKRKVVSFIREILHKVQRSGGRVYYVSRSESNLFGLLSYFIRNMKLPEGPLFLTSYLRMHQLIDPKKSTTHKKSAIRKIIQNSPGKSYLLLGDDTQSDMDVYADIVREFPEQIKKVYIRKTLKHLKGKREDHWNKLSSGKVEICYFDDTDDVLPSIEFIDNELKNKK